MLKKQIRSTFRLEVFERDNQTCVMCGYKPQDVSYLDAHHIVSRKEMPFGGYCSHNGISLCTNRCNRHRGKDVCSDRCTLPHLDCHQKAEYFTSRGKSFLGYSPLELYVKINSSFKKAYEESLKINLNFIDSQAIINRINILEEKEIELQFKSINHETWELICDDREEQFVRQYGKARQSIQ